MTKLIVLRSLTIFIGLPVFLLALVGAESDRIYPSLLDLAWLSIVGLSTVFTIRSKDWNKSILYTLTLIIFTYSSQLLALDLLSSVYLLSDLVLLDELWTVSTMSSRLMIAFVIGFIGLGLLYFLFKRHFIFVGALVATLSIPFFLGQTSVGINNFDSEDWLSISAICQRTSLFHCKWEKSNRTAITHYTPGADEVERAWSMLQIDHPLQRPALEPKNIYYISLESAFDFFPFWEVYPESKALFPRKYLEWVHKWGSLTAPGFIEFGSFNSRFVSLCGSYYALSPKTTTSFPCLPRALGLAGYETSAYDEAGPTYDLDVLYSRFGFQHTSFLRHEYNGYGFYQHVLDQIDFSKDTKRFVFLFPLTGHHGAGLKYFSQYQIPDLVKPFVNIIDNPDILISAASSLEYAVRFTQEIFTRDSEAIIIFRNDHLYPGTTNSVRHNTNIAAESHAKLQNSMPFLQRFMIVTNSEQSRNKHKRYVSPQSIPKILLQYAGIDADSTLESSLLSALSCEFYIEGSEYFCDYENVYQESEGGVALVKEEDYPETLTRHLQAKKMLSLDLFFGDQLSYKTRD